MADRDFDCFLLHTRAGTHKKLRRFSDSEWRCWVGGVLALAAESPVRGRLLIAEGVAATTDDIAGQAGVTRNVTEATLEKARALRMLLEDGEPGEVIHDFDEWNPRPRRDRTAAERMRRHRARQRGIDPDDARVTRPGDGSVTPSRYDDVTRNGRNGHAPEEEVEEEVTPLPPVTGGERAELSGLLAEIRQVLNSMPSDRAQLTELDDVRILSARDAHPTVDLLQAARGAVARGKRNQDRVAALLAELRTLETRAERTGAADAPPKPAARKSCHDCLTRPVAGPQTAGRCQPCYDAWCEQQLGPDDDEPAVVPDGDQPLPTGFLKVVDGGEAAA